jgi:outer membrane protein OmpA-like peptidoglycan-associated protein/ankyrin repeat protein
MKNTFYITLISALFFTACIQKEDLNTKNNISTKLALNDAIRAKNLSEVKRILSNDTLTNRTLIDEYGAMHLAVKLNHYEIAELLSQKGASLNMLDENKDTPLLISSRNSTNAISKMLLCNGAKKDIVDSKGFTSLDYAIKNNDLFIIVMLKSSDMTNMCEKLDISLEYYNKNENEICGKILTGKALNIDLILNEESNVKPVEIGKYNSNLMNDNYCAKLDIKLDSKLNYTVTARASNTIDIDIEIINFDDLERNNNISNIKRKDINISELYADLMKEFNKDFTLWDAELLKDGLIFRFKNPELLFAHGSSDLNPKYKLILNDFFPRYLNILDKYKNQIALVRIEGHTSSVYSAAKNEKERYAYNKELSSIRANRVFNYILSIDNSVIKDKKDWLSSSLKPYGMAYDDLIYDKNDKENESLSRRVEFKIIKK